MGKSKDLFTEEREYELAKEEENMQRVWEGTLHLRKRNVPMVLSTAQQDRSEGKQHNKT